MEGQTETLSHPFRSRKAHLVKTWRYRTGLKLCWYHPNHHLLLRGLRSLPEELLCRRHQIRDRHPRTPVPRCDQPNAGKRRTDATPARSSIHADPVHADSPIPNPYFLRSAIYRPETPATRLGNTPVSAGRQFHQGLPFVPPFCAGVPENPQSASPDHQQLASCDSC